MSATTPPLTADANGELETIRQKANSYLNVHRNADETTVCITRMRPWTKYEINPGQTSYSFLVYVEGQPSMTGSKITHLQTQFPEYNNILTMTPQAPQVYLLRYQR